MSRLALIGVTGAAVVVVAAGLIYAISQQEGDDSDTPETVPEASQAAPAQGTAGNGVATNAAAGGNAAATDPANATPTAASAPAGETAASQTQPSFDVVRVNPNGDAVIAGRAAPGSAITLLDNGQVIGTAKADDRGEWVLLPNSSVTPGEHKFTLQAQSGTDAPVSSERMVVVVVPAPAKDIAGNAVAAPAGALALSVPQEGEGPTEVLNLPGGAGTEAAPSGPTKEPTLDVVDFDKDGRMSLSGRALPGAKVALYLDDQLLGAAPVDERGRWSFIPQEKLAVGRHELRVDQVGADGKVSARILQPVEQPDFASLTPGEAQIVVQPGNSLWRLARRTYGDGLRYSVIFEANRDRVRDPDLIYPGQVLQLPQ